MLLASPKPKPGSARVSWPGFPGAPGVGDQGSSVNPTEPREGWGMGLLSAETQLLARPMGGGVLLSHVSAPACWKQLAWVGEATRLGGPFPGEQGGAHTLIWYPVHQETPEGFLEEAALWC